MKRTPDIGRHFTGLGPTLFSYSLEEKKRILVVGGLILLGAALFTVWRMRSDKYLVKKQFESICQAVSKQPGEGNAAMTVKMLTLGNLLDETVLVDLRGFPWNGESGSEELVSLAMRGRGYLDSLQVDPLEIEMDFLESGHVVACCAVRVSARSRNGFDHSTEIREFVSELVKNDERTWRFRSFREAEVLRR